MALGKNLKKKKLIENQSKIEKPKKRKATSPPEKKNLIAKTPPKENKPKPSKKKAEKKSPELKPEESFDPVLSNYIAKKLNDRKKELRAKYSEQIENLQNQMIQFISIQICGEQYAIDIDKVKEIVQVPNLSKTPNTPAHILGMANVRGKNYTVFDLATRFKVEEKDQPKYLLILNSNEIKASLTLALLPATFKVEGKNISSDLNIIEDASLDVSYIKGIIQFKESLIYYMDIEEMLKNDKAVVIPDTLMTR